MNPYCHYYLLSQVEEQQQQQNPNIPLVYKVPVTVEQDNTVISWAVETNSEVYWS